MDRIDAARELWRLGHAPNFPTSESALESLSSEAVFAEALESYQRYHGLEPTRQLDDATAAQLGRKRCCVHPDVMPMTSPARWAVPALTYYQAISLPGIDAATVAALYGQAWAQWEAVSGIRATPAADGAMIVNVSAVAGPIDGPGNVLALSELPYADAPSSLTLRQTFDQSEAWDAGMLLAVMTHEIGHCLGLGHSSNPADLMAPYYREGLCKPQAGDTSAIQSLYGPPPAGRAPAAPSDPSAAPPPEGSVTFTASAAGSYEVTLDVPEAGTYQITVSRV